MSVSIFAAALFSPLMATEGIPGPAGGTSTAPAPADAIPVPPAIVAPATGESADPSGLGATGVQPQAALPSQTGGIGDIIVTARTPDPGDPLEAVNAASFELVQAVDSAIIAPVAHGYEKGVPRPMRSGVHNLLNNFNEPIVFLNFLLQLKPGKAVETAARFAINSTIGIGGVVDVARRKPFNLPRRFNGLADTFGYYGVKPGPYFFLPLVGSTTLRDLVGRFGDMLILPAAIGQPYRNPAFSLVTGSLGVLDERIGMDADLERARASGDPYVAAREYYLANRQAEIDVLRGKRRSVEDPRPPEPKRHRHEMAAPPMAVPAP